MDYSSKPFMLLHSNFWDPLQKISKHHQIKCKYLLGDMHKENEEENKKNESKILTITESLKTIVQTDLRHYYFLYLKYNFCLCEPLTINQLKTNFKNKIFPYFLFTLIIKKKEIIHLIIDFFEGKILIINKDKILENISQQRLISVSKKSNISIILVLNDKGITNGKNQEIEIIPELFQQVDLIYTIINFFIKNYKEEKESKKDSEEESELSLLDDDIYVPKGMLLKAHILKEHQNKLLSKDKRYAVLGTSLIIIFKDNTMKEIRNIIPLLSYATQLISDDKELIITFRYFYRDQSLTFFEEKTYFEWKNTLKDIFNKKIVEKIEGITFYQIKEKKINSKIIDVINNEINEIEIKIKKNMENFEITKKSIIDNDNFLNTEKMNEKEIIPLNIEQ